MPQGPLSLVKYSFYGDLRRVANLLKDSELKLLSTFVYTSSMGSDTKKILYFIKTEKQNLQAIEAFLSKRNFVVHMQSDVKEALIQIIELQPDFVFVAWNHENQRVTQIPALISQAGSCVVVPYIMANTKEAVRKLNICQLSPKLFPPISGPAIERLILKYEKQNLLENTQRSSLIHKEKKSSEELIRIKSSLVENLEKANVEPTEESEQNSADSEQAEKKQHDEVKQQRQSSIRNRNALFKQSQKLNLDQQTVDALKNSFNDSVRAPLENLIQTVNEVGTDQAIDPDQIENQDTPSLGGVIIQKGFENPQGLGTIVQKSGAPSSMGSINLQNLEESPLGNIKNFSDVEKELSNKVVLLNNEKKSDGYMRTEKVKAYGMVVLSQQWCGYLIITSDLFLDFSSVDLLFTEWLRQHLPDLQEIDEYDFFEFRQTDPEHLRELGTKADYSESLEIEGHQINVSFFPVEPHKLNVELNDDQTLIKINTDEIPAGQVLKFSLHLHLPVNQKLLLYTPVSQALSPEQKKRLVNNHVMNLYSPLDFEKEYKQFKAERNVCELYEQLNKKFSAV